MDSTYGYPDHCAEIDPTEAAERGECDSKGNCEASQLGSQSGRSAGHVSLYYLYMNKLELKRIQIVAVLEDRVLAKVSLSPSSLITPVF